MGDAMTHIKRGTYFPSRPPTPLEFAEALVNDEVDGAPKEAIALAKAHVEAVAALRELVEAITDEDASSAEEYSVKRVRCNKALCAARKVLG